MDTRIHLPKPHCQLHVCPSNLTLLFSPRGAPQTSVPVGKALCARTSQPPGAQLWGSQPYLCPRGCAVPCCQLCRAAGRAVPWPCRAVAMQGHSPSPILLSAGRRRSSPSCQHGPSPSRNRGFGRKFPQNLQLLLETESITGGHSSTSTELLFSKLVGQISECSL